MGRNHNLYNGVRIGAPLLYQGELIDADNVANGRPIRNVTERYRTVSKFLPSVDWTFDDNITDTTPEYDTNQQVYATTGITDTVKRIQIQKDGKKLWVFGDSGSIAKLISWTLDTPFDLSSASNGWGNNSSDLTYSTYRYWRMMTDAQVDFSSADDWIWSEDGMRGYLFDGSQIYQYECSAPYTLVSSGGNERIIADSKVTNLRTESGETGILANKGNMFISRDGRYLFNVYIHSSSSVVGFINKFELSTPWDITGSLTTNQWADQSVPGDTTPFKGTTWPAASPSNFNYAGITFSPDGTRMFLQERLAGNFAQFELSKPWDLDTISPNIINTFKPTGSVSEKHTATYDGKYWYTWDNITGSPNTFSRYSQVKHGGNI